MALGLYGLLVATTVPFVFPFLWMLGTSLKELPQVFTYPPVWIPDPIRWANYPEALTRVQPFGLYFRNTAVIVGWVVLGGATVRLVRRLRVRADPLPGP
jgi:multiple sugar transport system permease protein